MAPEPSDPSGGRVFHVLLSMILLVIVLVIIAMGVSAQTYPPPSGDWVIGDHTVIDHDDITVSGNVTVASGGTLDLSYCTLSLDLPFHGAYHVEVRSGGTLVLDHVVLESEDNGYLYNFTVSGKATILGSEIHHLDGIADIDAVTSPQGLVVRTSSFYLFDSVVVDSRGFAILVLPGLTSDIEPEFVNSTIIYNGGGIACVGVLFSGNALIRNCTFYGNTIADVVAVAADPVIDGCTFGGSLFATSTIGVLAFGTAEPVVRDCTFSWTVAAIYSIAASPTVRDCTISLSTIGISIVGGDPVILRVDISTTISPMVLNATSALVQRCGITTFVTPAYAISIDGGDPTIDGCTVTNSLLGGAISVINGSTVLINRSNLSGSGMSAVVYVEDSQPSLETSVITGGSNGIELVDSPAYVRDCDIQNNNGWGIVSWFEEFTNKGNDFGAGGNVNGDGRVIQYHSLTVHVELEDGTPASGANIVLDDALDGQVLEVTTDGVGFAFSEVLVAYEVTNGNRTITYTPHVANATLGELTNVSRIDISNNPDITLVLRSVPNLPPMVAITSPVDGATYNAWDHREGIPLEGTAVDPEGGAVVMGWTVDGVDIEGEPGPLFLDPGEHTAGLHARDGTGLETRVDVSFSVVAVPPENFGVTIALPEPGKVYEPDEVVEVRASLWFEEHPYLDFDVTSNITWASSVDGVLPLVEVEGTLADLTYGEHTLTVKVTPMFPMWHAGPYTDEVSIVVLAPEPVAVANISSPEDGATFTERDIIMLSAEGSYLDMWDPPEHRVIYRWTSDLDGALGEGFELEARYLSLGVHTIRLELTTEPFIVSDNATVTITVEEPPNNMPVARISLLTTGPKAGEPVLLTGAGSVDPDGNALVYHWDLGDGNASDTMEVNHTYAEGGNYTVVLTVSDGEAEHGTQLLIEVAPADDDGNGGGNGGDGNGDGGDGGPVEPEEDSLWGWLLLGLLLLAVVAMLALAWRGRQQRK